MTQDTQEKTRYMGPVSEEEAETLVGLNDESQEGGPNEGQEE